MSQDSVYKEMQKCSSKWYQASHLADILDLKQGSVTRSLSRLVKYRDVKMRVQYKLNAEGKRVKCFEYKILITDN